MSAPDVLPHPLLEAKRAELLALCEQYGVSKLEVFGSAARGEFRPATSDLDFLVEFHDSQSTDYADRFFGLLFALEDLFKRRIDLVSPHAIRNRFFLRSVDRSRKLVYAA